MYEFYIIIFLYQNINLFGLNGPLKLSVSIGNINKLILLNKTPEFSESKIISKLIQFLIVMF